MAPPRPDELAALKALRRFEGELREYAATRSELGPEARKRAQIRLRELARQAGLPLIDPPPPSAEDTIRRAR